MAMNGSRSRWSLNGKRRRFLPLNAIKDEVRLPFNAIYKIGIAKRYTKRNNNTI